MNDAEHKRRMIANFPTIFPKPKNICKKNFVKKNILRIFRQLEQYPEFCETCKIKPCPVAVYIFKLKGLVGNKTIL